MFSVRVHGVVCADMYMCMCVCMYVLVCVCVCVCVCMCVRRSSVRGGLGGAEGSSPQFYPKPPPQFFVPYIGLAPTDSQWQFWESTMGYSLALPPPSLIFSSFIVLFRYFEKWGPFFVFISLHLFLNIQFTIIIC